MLARLFLVFGALTVISAAVCAAEPSNAKPGNRAEATAIIASARKILTPNGVERLEKVRIGGIEQWVSVRGTDRRNPVLLYIHGGPGYVSLPTSWWFARGWEEYFTVVQWDQRAAGKTQLLNDPAAVRPTLSTERMLADAEEMVAWVRKELGKPKIFMLGHSYGSFLGIQLAERHPDWFYAYIGVGQVINEPENERQGWNFAMAAARRDNNSAALRELNAIAPYPPVGKPLPIEALYTQRKWVGHYGGVMAYRHNNEVDSALANLSPDYTDAEIGRIWEGNKLATPILLPPLITFDMSATTRFPIPLLLLEGRHDYNVVADVAAKWFAKVSAPGKRLVWFEHSGHMPMTEEPGKFLLSLVRYARPIAERAGDVAPESDGSK